MRTYAAFGLLAIASGTAMAAPASPDLSREVGFSSLPNTPDLAKSSDMAAFASMPQSADDNETSPEDTSGDGLAGGKTEQLAQSPTLMARSALPYREYEKWLEQQRQARLGMSSSAKRDLSSSSDEMNAGDDAFEEAATITPAPAPATAGSARVPFTGGSEDLPMMGDKMPNIPGVERIIMVDGISGSDGVKIDTLENATKGYQMPDLKKTGPSRMRHRRRDLRSALEQLHMDESHADDAEVLSKAKQLSTLSRRVRRNPRPVDNIILHSNGVIPELPKALQDA